MKDAILNENITNNEFEDYVTNSKAESEVDATDYSQKSTKFTEKAEKNKKKTKKCKIIGYDKKNNVLRIIFDKYGVEVKNVKQAPISDSVVVEYNSYIGKSDFSFKIVN